MTDPDSKVTKPEQYVSDTQVLVEHCAQLISQKVGKLSGFENFLEQQKANCHVLVFGFD